MVKTPVAGLLVQDMKHRYKHVLQVLVKLLNEPSVRELVPEVLSRLTETRYGDVLESTSCCH